MSRKRILITGGAGFIGLSLTKALLISGHQVRILDNFSQQVHSQDTLPDEVVSDVELFRGDVRDRNLLKKAITGVDVIVHLAAETGTGQSMYEIDRYFSVNVQGTAVLLDLLSNDDCGKNVNSIVVASSRAVYGEGAYHCVNHNTVFPYERLKENLALGNFDPICPFCSEKVTLLATQESAPFMPMSMYGLTKQVQEQAVLLHARTKGVNAFGLRYQNVFGPGQSLKNPYTGILAVFSNLVRQDQSIDIYEDGFESRDFVFISDVVEATKRSIEFSGRFAGAINVGSGKATSVLMVAEGIKNFFNSKSLIAVSGRFRLGDIRHNIADITKLNDILAFQPQFTFTQGLHAFLSWAAEQSMHDKAAYLQSVNELSVRGLMGVNSVNKSSVENEAR